MKVNDETTWRLVKEKVCKSYAEARRLQYEVKDEEELEKIIKKKKEGD